MVHLIPDSRIVCSASSRICFVQGRQARRHGRRRDEDAAAEACCAGCRHDRRGMAEAERSQVDQGATARCGEYLAQPGRLAEITVGRLRIVVGDNAGRCITAGQGHALMPTPGGLVQHVSAEEAAASCDQELHRGIPVRLRQSGRPRTRR